MADLVGCPATSAIESALLVGYPHRTLVPVVAIVTFPLLCPSAMGWLASMMLIWLWPLTLPVEVTIPMSDSIAPSHIMAGTALFLYIVPTQFWKAGEEMMMRTLPLAL